MLFVETDRASEAMPVVDESLLAIADVAGFLSIPENTSYRLAQSGRIPAFMVGWVWRFREAETWNCLDEHRQSDSAGAKKEAKRSRMRGTK